jgi:release factor glutamine methyltransferase
MLAKGPARVANQSAGTVDPTAADAPPADAPPVAAIPATVRPAPEVIASDLSPGALELARRNAERHGAVITFVAGDLDQPLAALAPFDLIAANLPYIPSADIAGLAPEVLGEPRLALDGGADGLALVRRLVAAAPGLLRGGGAIALEIGAGQAEATAGLLSAAGFIDVRRRRDLGQIERVVSGRKP